MHYRQGQLLDRGQEGLLLTERRALHGYIQSLFGGGGLTGRISVAAASSASVILGASRQAPAQTSSFFLCEMCRGMVVCVGVSVQFSTAVVVSEFFSLLQGAVERVSRQPCRQGHHAVCNQLCRSRRQWQGGGQGVESRVGRGVVGCATASPARLAFRSLPVSGRGEACSAHGECPRVCQLWVVKWVHKVLETTGTEPG